MVNSNNKAEERPECNSDGSQGLTEKLAVRVLRKEGVKNLEARRQLLMHHSTQAHKTTHGRHARDK